MPHFRRKTEKTKKKKKRGSADPTSNPQSYNGASDPPIPAQHTTGGNGAAVSNNASRSQPGNAVHQSPARTQATTSSQPEDPRTPRKIVFRAFLAHGSPPGQVEGFRSVKELYEKIGQAYDMPADQILFCTLNTYKLDMEKLLGGQLVLGDTVYAHIKGQKYEIALKKSEPSLGITITDNGAGFAFVKRIKEGSVMSQNEHIAAGDHLVMINSQDMVGCRHYEVARALKDLPVGEEFTMKLWKPFKAFNEIGPRASKVSSAGNNNVGTGRATLRFHNKGPATVQALPSEHEQVVVKKVDDCLESYMGIRDLDLAASIVDMFQGKTDFLEFMTAFVENFGDFGFPEDFVLEVWGFISDAQRNLKAAGPERNAVVEFNETF